MKSKRMVLVVGLLIIGLLIAGNNGWGGTANEATNDNSELSKDLGFGKNTAFTATAITQGSYRSGSGIGEAFLLLGAFGLLGVVGGVALEQAMQSNTNFEIETHYAFLDGKLRMHNDMTRSPSNDARMKRVLNYSILVRPDKNVTYMIYQDLEAYCEMPNFTTAPNKNKLTKPEFIEIGRETVEGHPCIKYKVVNTMPDGKKAEQTVWQATDLNDFPVKIFFEPNGMTITYKNIDLSKPPAELFEIPAGYKHESQKKLMWDAYKRK